MLGYTILLRSYIHARGQIVENHTHPCLVIGSMRHCILLKKVIYSVKSVMKYLTRDKR